MPTTQLDRPQSFEASLVAAYSDEWPRLKRLTARLVGDDRAEEVVQEAVMKLWRAPERFDPGRGSLAAYLSVLCRGTALDRLRADAARRVRETRSASGTDAAMAAPPEPDEPAIARALSSLPEHERVPILLAVYGGLTYREAARSLGLPEGTVKSRIRSGLGRLRGSLDIETLR